MCELNLLTLHVIFMHGQHLMMNPWEVLKRINHQLDDQHTNLSEINYNPAYALLLQFWADRCCHVPSTTFHTVLLAACFNEISGIVRCQQLEHRGLL